MIDYNINRKIFIHDIISKINFIDLHKLKIISNNTEGLVTVVLDKSSLEINKLVNAIRMIEIVVQQRLTLRKTVRLKRGAKTKFELIFFTTLRKDKLYDLFNYIINILSILNKEYYGLENFFLNRETELQICINNINLLIGLKSFHNFPHSLLIYIKEVFSLSLLVTQIKRTYEKKMI